MSFVKDCIKVGIGYAAIIVGGYAGIAIGTGLFAPVSEAVNDKAGKILSKFKSEE